MKNRFYYVLSLLIICSCSRTPVEESKDELGRVAIEMQSDFSFLTYDRLLDEQTDADFIDNNVSAAMQTKSVYQYRRGASTKSSVEEIDTLRTSEEIPFFATVSEQTNIYQDGSSDYVRDMVLDPEINPLLCVHESPLDLSNCISRIEIKNGKSISYNPDGKILSEQDIEMPDYTEYLLMLKQAQKESEEGTRAGCRRDINWLRERMSITCPTKAGDTPSYRIWEDSEGNVILEQTVSETRFAQPITLRTKLSADISKSLGYEQRINGQLMVRSRNIFTDNPQTKSIGNPLTDISDENPSQTITESLSYTQDGTPKIKVEDRKFSVNRTVFHLK
ncbi:MAG: hypothetical protein IJR34_02530 [Bacteroidales bacterium]|nr:hypothetical protein [Bacteroidales bacterium]MBQ9597112.1 hypothetical protein [Bacteroidales bacterium]